MLIEVGVFAGVSLLVLVAQSYLRTPRARIAAWMAIISVPLLTTLVGGRATGGLLHTLFSSSAGWLSLTPVVYVALLGELACVRRHRVEGIAALAAVVIWAAAGAPMSGTIAVLGAGLASVVAWLRARPLAAIAPLVLLALAWNYWLMVQYTVGLLPKDEPISFAAMVRQQADVHTRAPYVYPFSFPANLWFAWREGVPADRYDILANEPRPTSMDLRMDEQADRFLLDGWDAPGTETRGPVRWIGQQRATLAVPLALPATDVQVGVTARARLEEPAVSADMAIEINGHEVGRFVAPATAPADALFTVSAANVGRVFRTGYNRVTIVSYGVHRVDPADQRPPGPLGRRTGSRVWPVAIYRVTIAPVP